MLVAPTPPKREPVPVLRYIETPKVGHAEVVRHPINDGLYVAITPVGEGVALCRRSIRAELDDTDHMMLFHFTSERRTVPENVIFRPLTEQENAQFLP